MGIVVPRLFQETDSFFWWVMGKKNSRGYSWTKCDKIKPSLYEDDSFAIFPSLQGCVYPLCWEAAPGCTFRAAEFQQHQGSQGWLWQVRSLQQLAAPGMEVAIRKDALAVSRSCK